MDASTPQTLPNLGRRWFRACMLGWFLGIVLVVLLSIAYESIGGGAQRMVGLGMGLGVGLLQARVLVPWLDGRFIWVVASMVGLSIPFILIDLASFLWQFSAGTWLPLAVLCGGLITSTWQARLLRSAWVPTAPSPTRAWVMRGTVGWVLGILWFKIFEALPVAGWPAMGLFVVAVFLGGASLATVTAPMLRALTPRSAAGGSGR